MEIHHDGWRRPWTGWTKPAMRCAATASSAATREALKKLGDSLDTP
jgi:hypothetical protein